MTKWFKRSLMALGLLFVAIMPIAVWAGSRENEMLDNIGVFLFIVGFGLAFTTVVTGLGALGEWLSRKSGRKAKRGLVYEDAMLNRIMSRLDDEERSYLEGYLAGQSYAPLEDYQIIEEEQQQKYE